MEGLISHALRLDYESALSDHKIHVIVVRVVVVVLFGDTEWEIVHDWLLSEHDCRHLSAFFHFHEAPVVEATLPELSKVYRDLGFLARGTQNVVRFDLVPREDGVMHLVQRRRGRQSQKELAFTFSEIGCGHRQLHFEVLTDASDHRPKSGLLLPISIVVEAVQVHHSRVSRCDV